MRAESFAISLTTNSPAGKRSQRRTHRKELRERGGKRPLWGQKGGGGRPPLGSEPPRLPHLDQQGERLIEKDSLVIKKGYEKEGKKSA